MPKTIVQHDFATDLLARPEELLVTGATLRDKVEKGFEVAKGVFVVGSLTGDSLIRFAFGGCCVVAGDIQRSVLRGKAVDGNRGGKISDGGNDAVMRRSAELAVRKRGSVGGGGDGIEKSLDLTDEWQS